MLRLDVLVPVSDVQKARTFYADLVGLVPERISEEFATLKAGDANLWLHREDDGPVDSAGIELWIGVDDVDDVHRRFVEAGLVDLRPPSDVPQWGLRVTSARIPMAGASTCRPPWRASAQRHFVDEYVVPRSHRAPSSRRRQHRRFAGHSVSVQYGLRPRSPSTRSCRGTSSGTGTGEPYQPLAR